MSSWFFDYRNPRHHYTDVQPLADEDSNDIWESPELANKIHPPPVAGDHISGYQEPGYRPPLSVPADQIPGATHHGGELETLFEGHIITWHVVTGTNKCDSANLHPLSQSPGCSFTITSCIYCCNKQVSAFKALKAILCLLPVQKKLRSIT